MKKESAAAFIILSPIWIGWLIYPTCASHPKPVDTDI